MECAISDISMEYEWYTIPPWQPETAEEETLFKDRLRVKDGKRTFKFASAGFCGKGTNEPNSLLVPELYCLEESCTLVLPDGNSWAAVNKHCYNNHITRHLNIGGWPAYRYSGSILAGQNLDISLVLTPLGFSVLLCRLSTVIDYMPLSAFLRRDEFVRLDDEIRQVNDFNTIRVELLQNVGKAVFLRVYFSVDHSYTPVRYEHMSGGKPAVTVDVHSLQKVAEGLWFPSSGTISTHDSEHVNGFQAIGQIIVNQGLGAKDFDIAFPPGTKVHDEIRNVTYTLKPSEEQFDFPQ